MKVTILGSGSGYGVPYAGGGWGDCNPDNPKNRRLSPSILIENDDTRMLVDMSPDFREQSERHNIRLLDGVFFTHAHSDHITGMFHLPVFMAHYQNQDLQMYADIPTRLEIEKAWYMFNESIRAEYYGPGRPLWNEVKEYCPFNIGSLEIKPFMQDHGRIHSLGLRAGNFAYSTDVCSFPEESHAYLENLDVWMVDCNCATGTDKSHSYVEKSLAWIEKFKPKKAYLCHLDSTIDYDKISATLPTGVELAYDNLEIIIKD